MRTGEIKGEIKALTGLRIVAAVWVVLFHFRPMLADASPDFLDALAPVLNMPSYDHNFGANLDTMLKWHDGSAYVFSMISGESTSFAGSRTFALPSALAGASSVEVVNENRTIPVSDGTFNDNFQHEYTYHIYRITP